MHAAAVIHYKHFPLPSSVVHYFHHKPVINQTLSRLKVICNRSLYSIDSKIELHK